MAERIVTREEARLQGSNRYYTGVLCRHGHDSERRVADTRCVACLEKSVAAWRAANPEKWRESNRVSKTSNQNRYNAVQRDDYAKNPEKYKAAWKRYYKKKRAWHIERATVTGRKRRAQMKGSGGDHTAAEARAILAAQGHRCANCGTDLQKAKKHVDHIVPLARGGSNDKGNLQYLCAPCNLAKGARDPIEFAQAQGRLL